MGRKITPPAEVAAESAALRRLLAQRREPLTQEQLGHDYGIGTANMVWQYMSGYRPLNLEAAIRFSRGLECRIDDFSPRLATLVREALSLTAPARPTGDTIEEGAVTAEEAELLRAYRALQEKDRNSLRRQAIALALMAVEPATNERVQSAFSSSQPTPPPARRRKTT